MNKIATLAKIANRLDSLGLVKEADVLDAFIRKVAEDLTPPNPEGTAAPVATKDGTTTWKDGEYTYSFNPETYEMYIVSGPKMTAPQLIKQDTNEGAYYTILNQYQKKEGIPPSSPSPALTDETEIRNMIQRLMTRYNLQLQNEHNNRLKQDPDFKGTWIISFIIKTNGAVGNATAVAKKDTMPDRAFEAGLVKVVSSWKFAKIAEDQPVTKTMSFGS